MGDFQFDMTDAVLYDKDGNALTTEDQIVVNGRLSVSPNIEFRMKIIDSKLEELYFSSNMSVQTGFTVSSKISIDIPLIEHQFGPAIPLGDIPVGPLVLSPELKLVAGISGSVYSGISTSITNTTSCTAGLWHLGGTTHNLSKFDSYFSFKPLSSQSGVSFKAFVGPKITGKIYKSLGLFVTPAFAVKLDIVPAANPWLTIKGGLEVSVGLSVSIPIINKDILKIHLGAINFWALLYALPETPSSQPGKMVPVPAGKFQMGCDPAHSGGIACNINQSPLHTIFLDAYYIDKYEVTNGEYADCVSAGGCRSPLYNTSYSRGAYFSDPAYKDYPVIFVSWADARDYCAWGGKRLPTEAEFEKAAKGSAGARTYPWGDSSPDCTLANFLNSGYCVGDTSAVGSYPAGASVYGVMDIAGNVSEWVNDWWAEGYYQVSPASNPTGPSSGTNRVIRVGSWDDYGYNLRVASRYFSNPSDRLDHLGFRCALSSAGQAVPSSFGKIVPSNSAAGLPTSLVLDWEDSNGVASYAYCYDTSNDNACSNWTSSGTASQASISGLSSNTTYYWQARATNGVGSTYANGSAASFWSFTTTSGVSLPAAFSKVSPANGASGLPASLTLDWQDSDGATGYVYCYDTTNDNACSNWMSSGSASQASLSGLSPNTTYYWQARATNNGGGTYANGSAAAFWSFTTAASVSLPAAFNKVSPTSGASHQPTSLTLDWQDSSGAASYAYCYDTSNDNACSNWTSSGTASQASLSGLSPSTTYYWQARATNGGGSTYANGGATAFWSFTTRGSVGETVLIPAGSFQMGCDPNHAGVYGCMGNDPLHTIYLDAYRIDKFEVTNAQYAQCEAGGACAPRPYNSNSWTRTSYYGNPTYANYPVLNVTWQEAVNFCTWAGKRLPSEAEWEKAARGSSDTRPYPWGEASPTCSLANFTLSNVGCGVGDTTAVGSYPADASLYGVMDVAGNVSEWVQDWYQYDYYTSSPASNPQGPATGTERVLRGGSYRVIEYWLDVFDRSNYAPVQWYSDIGFRCAAAP